jgi:hypothetical protein
MADEADQKQPCLPKWVTLLAVAGVVVGGVGGALTGEEPLNGGWLSGKGGRGLAGALLGFVAGVAFIAWDWFAPRQSTTTRLPVGSEGSGATQGAGKLPVQGIRPAFSFGQRLFAFLLWTLLGMALIFACAMGAWKFFDPASKKLLFISSLREMRVPMGAMIGGVLLLIGYSLVRVRLFVGGGEIATGFETTVGGPLPESRAPRLRGWWGAISLGAVFCGLLFGAMLFLASYNPVGHGPRPLGEPAMILIWSSFHAFGLFAAVTANNRDERRWGLTVLGLVLNAGLVFLIVLLWMSQ